jgi:nucleoside-diphosphate-sugar epimerase
MKQILQEDLQRIAESGIPFASFQDKTILITGATGLVGSLTARVLLYCNRVHHLNLRVLAVVRNREKGRSLFSADFQPELENGTLQFVVTDLAKEAPKVEGKCDYIVHAAAVTTSKLMVSDPVGTIKTAVEGTDRLLRFAVEAGCQSFVYLSSMEIYGQPTDVEHTTEQALGYVDLTSPRSCYPEGKRMCECLCTAYAAQYGLNVKSARLAQTFGAGILPTENRVFAQFARSAMAGTDIVLHTTGGSEGNYVYTSDAVSGILTLLVSGEAGQPYNVANEANHCTIRQMAELVAGEIAGGTINVVIDIPEDSAVLGYAPPVRMHLDAAKLRGLGWRPQVGLAEAYRRMMAWMEP